MAADARAADFHPMLAPAEELAASSYSSQLAVAKELRLHDELHVLPARGPSEEQRVWLRRLIAREKRMVDLAISLVRKNGPVEAYALRAVESMRKRDRPSLEVVSRLLQRSVHFMPSGSGVVLFRAEGRVLVLTCAHCLMGDGVEGARSVVIDARGQTYTARCVAADAVADLAIVEFPVTEECTLEAVFVADEAKYPMRVLCCGNPMEPGRGGYPPFHVSLGVAEDVAEGDTDPSVPNRGFGYGTDLGGLKHTAWTFWGHSGSPIVDADTGILVGIHSSWNDKTGKRHGVSLPVIRRFLTEHEARLVPSDESGPSDP
jgi:S1-C subfamily serine protease